MQCDSTSGETMYLTRFREPLLEFATVDSAKPDNRHTYRISIIPDPSREYQVKLGSKVIAYSIYLAPGDSLVFRYDPLHGDSLIFDRVGANRDYRDSPKPWYRDRQYYHNFDTLDWYGWRGYLSRFRNLLDARGDALRKQFPHHTGLYDLFHADATEAYYYGLMYYLSNNYWDSTGKPIINDPKRFRVLDSIPWTLPLFSRCEAIYALAQQWPYLSWQRWYHAGIDTAGETRFVKMFEFGHRLPAPACDAAEIITFSDATYGSTPSKLVPDMDRELKTYRRLASDTAYLGAFERKLAALRDRLPGKLAPSFALRDTSGKFHTLSEFRGKIIYLDFWGTWCPPCRRELPHLLKLEKSFENDTNIAFISIALQASSYPNQSPAGWRKFISKRGLHGTQLYADGQFQNPTARSYGIFGVPTFMLINRDGTFINAAAPRPSSGKAEAAIRAALAEKGE